LGPSGENDIHPDVNTIGWGPIDRIKIPFNFFYPEGTMQGKGVGNGTFFPVRGNDTHLPNLLESLCQDDNTFGTDTIIVRDQNFYSFGHQDLEDNVSVTRVTCP
jgi:hypothetical protein